MYLDFLVEISDVKGKITRKPKGDAVYINYEYGREYDRDRKYNIPKRVIIGKLIKSDPLNVFCTFSLQHTFRMKDLERWYKGRDMAVMPDYGTYHSCYPFYRAFLNTPDAEKLRNCQTGSALTSGQAKSINGRCGFPKSHKKNLWYCPACVREDIAVHGETCWRRLPQLPGAVYCPVHRERFQESGVSFREINYRIIPATYAVFYVPESTHESGTVYSERYIRLAEDMAWLMDKGNVILDWDWLFIHYFRLTGRQINAQLLYHISLSTSRGNRFEDYLANRIMKESGKDRIEGTVSRQIGSILSIERSFGTMEKFCLA